MSIHATTNIFARTDTIVSFETPGNKLAPIRKTHHQLEPIKRCGTVGSEKQQMGERVNLRHPYDVWATKTTCQGKSHVDTMGIPSGAHGVEFTILWSKIPRGFLPWCKKPQEGCKIQRGFLHQGKIPRGILLQNISNSTP